MVTSNFTQLDMWRDESDKFRIRGKRLKTAVCSCRNDRTKNRNGEVGGGGVNLKLHFIVSYVPDRQSFTHITKVAS